MRMEEAQLEQDIIALLSAKDGGLETNELIKEFSNYEKDDVKGALVRLKSDSRIDSRSLGKVDYWYLLTPSKQKKVLIVEDDKDINNLIRLSISDGYEVESAFDGGEALKKIHTFKPDLVVLDLMLPGPNGLEICEKIKSSPDTKNTTVIIVSAADAAVNRFFGIKNGADYYIKKPFEPMELKALTNIFLKKHGSLFDPLVDLPDIRRLLDNIKSYIKEDAEFIKVDLEGLEEYRDVYGDKDARLMVRLVSQMLQDKINESEGDLFLSYLGESSFVVAAKSGAASKLLSETEAEFRRVTQFIKQKHMHGDLMEKLERGKTGAQSMPLKLVYFTINMEAFKKQFESKILPDLTSEAQQANLAAVKNYSLDQIRNCFESVKDVDVSIKEMSGNLRITAGREGKRR
ncbi:Chemotaxis protein CheY [uncultured archaeon]|nr:Chemotaxis protein CheY [uncultured archaeon]